MRAYAYHCLSAAARIRQLLRAAGALLPLRETLRLPALTLVQKLGPTSELERLLSCSDRPFFVLKRVLTPAVLPVRISRAARDAGWHFVEFVGKLPADQAMAN
jgi:hypothetical protein